ncbi:MAG: hypothetical protein JW803_04240 [Endomicrobiales bacterium]|nr:hypothetical protein [Endomicrobiales bacterium]
MKKNESNSAKKGFLIKSLTKDVDVSANGHGIANYEVKLLRKCLKTRFIEHQIGGEESVPASIRVGSLKEANSAWENEKDHYFLRNYTFIAETIMPAFKKVYWLERKPLGNNRRFKIDLDSTFGVAREVSYGYGWTFPQMFSGISAKGELSSSVSIQYPTELLTLRINFPCRYWLEDGPKVEVYDQNGHRRSCSAEYERLNLIENFFNLQFAHRLGSNFVLTVENPPQGYVFKTIWRIEKP